MHQTCFSANTRGWILWWGCRRKPLLHPHHDSSTAAIFVLLLNESADSSWRSSVFRRGFSFVFLVIQRSPLKSFLVFETNRRNRYLKTFMLLVVSPACWTSTIFVFRDDADSRDNRGVGVFEETNMVTRVWELKSPRVRFLQGATLFFLYSKHVKIKNTLMLHL